MEAMGGRLEVKSTPGQGTTVTLLLPVAGMGEQEKERGRPGERRYTEMLNVGKVT